MLCYKYVVNMLVPSLIKLVLSKLQVPVNSRVSKLYFFISYYCI